MLSTAALVMLQRASSNSGIALATARALTGLLSSAICSSGGGPARGLVTATHSPSLAGKHCRGHAAVPRTPAHRGFAAEAAESPPDTIEDLELIRSQIFGNHIGNGERSGRKVLRKRLKGEKVLAWYNLKPMAKLDPLFQDPDIERCACTAACTVTPALLLPAHPGPAAPDLGQPGQSWVISFQANDRYIKAVQATTQAHPRAMWHCASGLAAHYSTSQH